MADLLRIPSVSTLPQHDPDVARAAVWVKERLERAGLEARLLTVGRHPLVLGEWKGATGRPTVLCYAHYDVQPPDPLEAWVSPPFDPTIRDGFVYARGASDDKGQLLAIICAAESLLQAEGRLPVNLQVLLEGEEEVGSPTVVPFVVEHGAELRADAMLACDGLFYAPDVPSLLTGLRGLLYTEVEARGAAFDLHSGQYGGAAPNPLEALARIIADLKDRQGRVTIPQFYASVRAPYAREQRAWESLPFSEAGYLKEIGADAAPGEDGYGILERRWSRPTLEVHGIAGGFVGPGAKTVIPAHATGQVQQNQEFCVEKHIYQV